MTFPCEQCGACCRLAKCSKLNADNLCDIYTDRPTICRVELMADLQSKLTKEEYFNLAKEFCRVFRKRG